MSMRTEAASLALAGPGEAAQLVGLLRRCYGRFFPFPASLSPTRIRRSIADGEVVYAVARDEGDERVVGQAALERTSAAGLWELNRAVVDETVRDRGLFGQLGRYLLTHALPGVGGRYVYGHVVTSHLHAQRFGLATGFVPTGLILGYLPREMVAAGIERPRQDTSALVMVRRSEPSPRPRAVTLEGDDRRRVLEALDALEIRSVSDERARRRPRTTSHTSFHDDVRAVRVVLGADASTSSATTPAAVEELGGRHRARLLWVDVPIEHARAAELVELARRRWPVTYGAYLPNAGSDGEDILRLQRYLVPTPLDRDAILVVDEARGLRDAIFAEADAVLVGAVA